MRLVNKRGVTFKCILKEDDVKYYPSFIAERNITERSVNIGLLSPCQGFLIELLRNLSDFITHPQKICLMKFLYLRLK